MGAGQGSGIARLCATCWHERSPANSDVFIDGKLQPDIAKNPIGEAKANAQVASFLFDAAKNGTKWHNGRRRLLVRKSQ
jgi:hypothetical protein